MPNLRRTARNQARAEVLPQLQGVRRDTRQQIRGLRSEEDPLTAGVQAQLSALRGAGLRRPEYETAAREAAAALADIPAGIQSQVLSTREAGQEQIGDLRGQEAAQFHSIYSQLQTAAAEAAAQAQQEEHMARFGSNLELQQGLQEKQLGLGEYAPPPPDTLNPLEQAQIPKVEAETRALEHPSAAANLTPSERRGNRDEHAAAQHFAKQLFEEAKAGALIDPKTKEPTIDPDPQSWTASDWNHLVTAVQSLGKTSVPAAERAVGYVKDHVDQGQVGPPRGAAGPLNPGLQALAGAAAPGIPGANALLKRLAPLPGY